MPSSASSAETMRRVLETDRLEVHTCLPGRVRSYDQASQTAEIELEIRQVTPARDDDDDDAATPYPVLPQVPVVCLRGANFFVHIPLAEGDKVMVFFAESDLNEWRRTGALTDPGVATRHGLSGAFCIPGIHHQRNPLGGSDIGTPGPETPPYMTIGREGGQALLKIRGDSIEAGGTDQLARWAGVSAHLDAIEQTLNSIATVSGVPAFTVPYVKSLTEGVGVTPTSKLKGA